MPRSYYQNNAAGQSHSVMTRPTAGLDKYKRASTISDTSLSDAIDVYPEQNDILKFMQYKSGYAGIFDGQSNRTGVVKASIMFNPTNDNYALCNLVWDSTDSKYYIRQADLNFMTVPFIGTFDVSSAGWLEDSGNDFIFGSCLFATEAKRYAIFTCTNAKKLLWFDGTAIGVVTIPFYPKRIVSHVNRIFAIDTGNKLWWCRAGDFNTWYGLEQDDDYIVTSTNCKNGAFTIAAQPDVPRPLMLTLTAVDASDTYGTFTVVGTARDGSTQTKVYTPVVGVNIFPDDWKTITSITESGWSASGGTDTVKVGIAAIGTGYVQEDQGYWTMEREQILCDLGVLGNNLYIWSPKSIYVFSGYSPETFALTMAIADLGLSNGATSPQKHLAIVNNVSYFMSNKNVYEFTGAEQPRIISHSIEVNGSVGNYLYGGIEEYSADYYALSLTADMNRLYFYNTLIHTNQTGICKVFDIKSRSWWILSGFNKDDSYVKGGARVLLVTDDKRAYTLAVVSNTVDNYFDVYSDRVGTLYGTNKCSITTKAFTANPSEDGTLTSIVLTLKGTTDKLATVTLSYSKTEDGDDFEIIEEKDVYLTGNLESHTFLLHPSIISRTLLYRLKLEVTLDVATGYNYSPVYLYGFERVHRIMGRSR